MKWNATLYDNNHDFVSKYGEELITLLDPKEGEKILDAGCGTGDLAELIRKKGAMVMGIDNSAEMIEEAKKKYPLINFQLASLSNLPFENSCDAVFSNAVLHWVLEKEKAAEQIFKSLKPAGRFVAEFGGKGNVANIVRALKETLLKNHFSEQADKEVWYFPSVGEYASLLEKQGFSVAFAAFFDRETPLKDENGIKNWLKMFGRPFLEGLNEEQQKKVLSETEKQLLGTNYKNSGWFADYKRLRIVAFKG
ncbi:MAG: class I SAM-dependent methyltransferase [Ginsengibacter sp.]